MWKRKSLSYKGELIVIGIKHGVLFLLPKKSAFFRSIYLIKALNLLG